MQKKALGYNMKSCSASDSGKLEQLDWSGLYSIDEGISRTTEVLREIK